MNRVLMLRNEIVYNIDSQTEINHDLLPGLMQKNPCRETFRTWMERRYNATSNSLARMLQGKSFGQGNREKINANTHALSLSDSYWIQDLKAEDLKFENISPYFNDFWKGIGDYKGGAIPTLYVSGAMSKAWISSEWLKKDGNINSLNNELIAIDFCKACNVTVNEAYIKEDSLYVKNITSVSENTGTMLEQADMSGLINPYDFTIQDIIDTFKEHGVKMLAIDAIVGNGDRHAGNFGFIRDTVTGKYIGMAPLYDFDHAFDASNTEKPDVLINELKNITREYYDIISEISNVAAGYDNEIIKKRAKLVCKVIGI